MKHLLSRFVASIFAITLLATKANSVEPLLCDCENEIESCGCESIRRFKRQTTSNCSDTAVPALPSHLVTPTEFVDGYDASGNLQLRCLNGMVLNMTDNGGENGFLTGGYFVLQCDLASSEWIPPSTWPPFEACIPGSACPLSQAPTLGDHLQASTAGDTEIISGNLLKYGCVDSAKVLNSTYAGFAVECYNGEFLDSPKIPPADACVDPLPCDLTKFTEARSFMQTNANLSSTIEHGDVIDFFCKDDRTLNAAKDPDGDNLFSIECNNGEMIKATLWPDETECHAVCSNITLIPDSLGFDLPAGPVNVLSSYFLNMTCSDPTNIVNNTWTTNFFELECLSTGEFKDYGAAWPACIEKAPCGLPPQWPVNSGLRAESESEQVWIPDSAVFKCREPGKVTDLGPTIEIRCIMKPGESNATFQYPKGWGGAQTKCRDPIICKNPFEAPLLTGLEIVPQNESYYEFSNAQYRCKDSSLILYKDQMPMGVDYFDVKCGLGGEFVPPPEGWPLCDSVSPNMCTVFPTNVPSIVDIVKKEPQLPGGKIYYKCKQEGFISNLGPLVEVECVKGLDGALPKFVTPNGWKNLKCRSEIYPDFRADACFCPGDEGISEALHLQILQLCYEAATTFDVNPSAASMSVPMKRRCGVGSLHNVTKENLCFCTERTDAATDFAIWSRVEITNYDFHANFTEPSTKEFKLVKKLLEKELDLRILKNWKNPDWRFVRSKVIYFGPSHPKKCSLQDLPEPDPASGLVVSSTKSVLFDEHAEFKCSNPDYVTDDGFIFKLQCLSNGQFRTRKWETCRPRETCSKTPPRPPAESGLQNNYTRTVLEFGYATYKCIDPAKVVEGTPDGRFSVMCKKQGIWPQAAGKYGVEWPTCGSKPSQICEPIMDAPEGYVDAFERTLYVVEGTTIAFKCATDGYLAGDVEKIYYTCAQSSGNATTGYELKPVYHDTVPTCRAPAICPSNAMPIPDESSGLSKPLQAKELKELEYVDYDCANLGISWSLLGEYTPNDDYLFDSKVEIIDGKLRIRCGPGGNLGIVAKWPKCRDSSVTGCAVTSSNPKLPVNDLSVSNLGSSVAFGEKITVACKDPTKITEAFVNLELACQYDGKFTLPVNLSFTPCRAPTECPESPTPPAETFLVATPLVAALKEHEIQEYTCSDGYTLAGVLHPLVTASKKVEVPCRKSELGAFLQPPEWSPNAETWPTCLPITTECSEYPQLPGFTFTSSEWPVKVGSTITAECYESGKVTYLGASFTLTCAESGLFDMPPKEPYCRAPIMCPTSPSPPNNTLLEESFSVDVKEWGRAHYSCQPGSKIPDSVVTDIIDGNFTVECGSIGVYPETVNWPECEITHCMEIPDQATFKADLNPPVPVGDVITYICATPGEVPDNASLSLESTCQSDGTFSPIDLWPTCRTAISCPASPVPDQATTFLLATSTSGVKEYMYAKYSCQPGATLAGVTGNANVVNNQFQVKCEVGGIWPTSVNWPTCRVENCSSLLVQTGYTSTTALPVPVGGKAKYFCANAAQVTDGGPSFDLTCGPNGNFVPPATWPTCRNAALCTNIPIPPASSNLLKPTSVTSVKEFQNMSYPCKADGKFESSRTAFELLCPLQGNFPAASAVTWPTCVVSNCLTIPSINGFTKLTDGPVPVGGFAEYECVTSDQVTDLGAVMKLQCQDDGSFLTPSWPTCRSRGNCSESPPTPDLASKLQPSTSTDLNEFDDAVYSCEDTYTLLGVTMSGVANNQFSLQCGIGGAFPASVTWPTCRPTVCPATDIPPLTGFTTSASADTPIGDSISFTCAQSGQVTDSGKFLIIPCSPYGGFVGPQTLPTCRDPVACSDTIPSPPASSNLQASTSTVANEFDTAAYSCKSGLLTETGKSDFSLTCGLGGKFPASPTWPTCKALSCDSLPSNPEFTIVGSSSAPIGVGKAVTYQCATPGYVHDGGKYVTATCGTDGIIATPNWPTCRASVACSDAIPTPPAASQLATSTTTVSKEFDAAKFPCKTGYALQLGVPTFDLTCGLGGTFPTSPSWPTCFPLCKTHPTLPAEATMEPLVLAPSVAAGLSTPYKCKGASGSVTNQGKTLDVLCGTDGNFILPASWPTCRDAVQCSAPPAPPASSNLAATTSTGLKEFDVAVYACNAGFSLSASIQPYVGRISADGQFELPCGSGGSFTINDAQWPVCKAARKKRYILYEGLKNDVTYTINAIFETQWMFTDGVESDILAERNFSMKNPNFPKAVIEVFHERIEETLGDLDFGAVKLSGPVHPSCEQPMTSSFPSGCVLTQVTPVCPNEAIEGAWLKSLGFTYKKQLPNWTNDSFTGVARHKVPVGGAIEFYCIDSLKRPKKDPWDQNKEDGIISAYCTHTGLISITMNPGDWDRCRRLCPVQKPKAPLIPGAQLISYSTEKDDKELWEDDTIVYGCENSSLVINRRKGVHSVSYKCMNDGTYATPKGKEVGDPWPECTLKPVDPFIVDAIVLLTGKFDRNLVYLQELAKTGDTEPDTLDTTVAIIAITIPVMVAIVAFIFFCMCFSRADSPICKIFEPQA